MLALRGAKAKADLLSSRLVGFNLEFYKRVWGTDISVYYNRMKAAGFEGFSRVLDAGCGFGQWSMCLARLNQHVVAIDIDKEKVFFLNQLCKELGIANIAAETSPLERTDFADRSFDLIYCYSVIFLTNYRETVSELSRITNEGGVIYICSNGLGWYIYNLIGNATSSLPNTRQMAINAFANTIKFLYDGSYSSANQLILPSEMLSEELERQGFRIISISGEGEYKVKKGIETRRFFEKRYFGEEGVYEIVAEKSHRG